LIDSMTGDFEVKELCQAMGVSRSGYYAWRNPEVSAREADEAELLQRIEKLHQDHRQRLGSPRMAHYLRGEGGRCSENRVARLMRREGIAARRKKPFRPKTTQPGKSVSENHLKTLAPPTGPDEIWVSDITYVATCEGYLYLATVMDLFTRQIVGWKLEETMEAWIVEAAIARAVKSRQPSKGIYFHSDRGSQYGGRQVRGILEQIGAISSMSGKGNCYDNAFAESFFSTLKAESFPSNMVFATKQIAQLSIFEYLEGYYNNKRLHSSLGYMTPIGFEENWRNSVVNCKLSANIVDADREDRAMRGRNSSARSASKTVGRPLKSGLPAHPPDGESKRKIHGDCGTVFVNHRTNKTH
jgi:putative transposase